MTDVLVALALFGLVVVCLVAPEPKPKPRLVRLRSTGEVYRIVRVGRFPRGAPKGYEVESLRSKHGMTVDRREVVELTPDEARQYLLAAGWIDEDIERGTKGRG